MNLTYSPDAETLEALQDIVDAANAATTSSTPEGEISTLLTIESYLTEILINIGAKAKSDKITATASEIETAFRMLPDDKRQEGTDRIRDILIDLSS